MIGAMTSAFHAAAQRLGLSHGTTSGVLALPFLQGELHGQRVRASWGDRATRVAAFLEPPLDLGLQVQSRGFVSAPSFGRSVKLGVSNWDDEVDATADEPRRAAV